MSPLLATGEKSIDLEWPRQQELHGISRSSETSDPFKNSHPKCLKKSKPWHGYGMPANMEIAEPVNRIGSAQTPLPRTEMQEGGLGPNHTFIDLYLYLLLMNVITCHDKAAMSKKTEHADVYQIRITPELKRRFMDNCHRNAMNPSAVMRMLMDEWAVRDPGMQRQPKTVKQDRNP